MKAIGYIRTQKTLLRDLRIQGTRSIVSSVKGSRYQTGPAISLSQHKDQIMIKKTIAISALFMLPLMTVPLPSQASQTSSIDTSVNAVWKIDAKPIDVVHTLDNKRVFILGDDSKIHVFATDGGKQGTIPVDKGVTAIDIAPRGELLYLINQKDNTFTSLTVSFTATIDVTGAPFLGNENAPVVLALFSDFQ